MFIVNLYSKPLSIVSYLSLLECRIYIRLYKLIFSILKLLYTWYFWPLRVEEQPTLEQAHLPKVVVGSVEWLISYKTKLVGQEDRNQLVSENNFEIWQNRFDSILMLSLGPAIKYSISSLIISERALFLPILNKYRGTVLDFQSTTISTKVSCFIILSY